MASITATPAADVICAHHQLGDTAYPVILIRRSRAGVKVAEADATRSLKPSTFGRRRGGTQMAGTWMFGTWMPGTWLPGARKLGTRVASFGSLKIAMA